MVLYLLLLHKTAWGCCFVCSETYIGCSSTDRAQSPRSTVDIPHWVSTVGVGFWVSGSGFNSAPPSHEHSGLAAFSSKIFHFVGITVRSTFTKIALEISLTALAVSIHTITLTDLYSSGTSFHYAWKIMLAENASFWLQSSFCLTWTLSQKHWQQKTALCLNSSWRNSDTFPKQQQLWIDKWWSSRSSVPWRQGKSIMQHLSGFQAFQGARRSSGYMVSKFIPRLRLLFQYLRERPHKVYYGNWFDLNRCLTGSKVRNWTLLCDA